MVESLLARGVWQRLNRIRKIGKFEDAEGRRDGGDGPRDHRLRSFYTRWRVKLNTEYVPLIGEAGDLLFTRFGRLERQGFAIRETLTVSSALERLYKDLKAAKEKLGASRTLWDRRQVSYMLYTGYEH